MIQRFASRHIWLPVAAAVALMTLAGTALDDVGVNAPTATAQQGAHHDNYANREQWYEDDFTGTPLFPLHRSVVTNDATLEAGETAACAPIGATVWYAWWADRPGTLEIDTGGSDFATVVSVYVFEYNGTFLPSPPGAQLRSLACDGGAGRQGRVSLQIEPGREYLIQIGGYAGATGTLDVRASCACPPPNDQLGNASYLYLDAYQPSAQRSADTALAGVDPGEPTDCGNVGRTVWYTVFVAAPPERVLFEASSPAGPVAIAVYRLTSWDAPFDGAERLGCAVGAPLALRLDNAYEYRVQIGLASGGAGPIHISVRCDPSCPPYNDNVAHWEFWEPPATTYANVNTASATLEAGEPRPCGAIGRTVWYQLTARGDTTITVRAASQEFAPAVAAYAVAGFSPPPAQWDVLDCDAAAGPGDAAEISFGIEAHEPYYVQVGGVAGSGGVAEVTFDCDPQPCPPYNDSMSYPEWLPANVGSGIDVVQGIAGATLEDDEPLACGDPEKTIWYALEVLPEWSAYPLLFTTEPSDFDTTLALYRAPLGWTDANFGGLTPIACKPGGAGLRAQLEIALEPGARYLLQVGGQGDASGVLRMSVNCRPYCPPENDNIAGAWYSPPGWEHVQDIRGATIETGEPVPACGALDHSVWYRVDPPPGTATFTFDARASGFPTIVAGYSIEGLSPPGGIEPVEAGCGSVISFAAEPGRAYYVQVGVPLGDAGGELRLLSTCDGDCYPGPLPIPVDTGQGGGGAGGVFPPETGNGGYLGQ